MRGFCSIKQGLNEVEHDIKTNQNQDLIIYDIMQSELNNCFVIHFFKQSQKEDSFSLSLQIFINTSQMRDLETRQTLNLT